MNRRVKTLWGVCLAVLVLGVCTGCETGFIQDAARDSLVEFVTSVFDTAVTSAAGV